MNDARMYHTRKVEREIPITTGTNMLDTLSANSWIGAWFICASSINLQILDKTVSLPTFLDKLGRKAAACKKLCLDPINFATLHE